MKLSHKELEIQSGQFGKVRKLALEHQMQVGKFFDAQSFVEISQVHIMADTEALGLAGIEYLENLAQYPDPQKKFGYQQLQTLEVLILNLSRR